MHPHMFISPTPHLLQSETLEQHVRKPGGIRHWLGTAFRSWERRKMIKALRVMDDRLLRDIGIDRSDIALIVDGFTDRELGMRPVSSGVEVAARRDRCSAE